MTGFKTPVDPKYVYSVTFSEEEFNLLLLVFKHAVCTSPQFLRAYAFLTDLKNKKPQEGAEK